LTFRKKNPNFALMSKKYFFILCCLLVGYSSLKAQDVEVSGKIFSEDSTQTLPHVLVRTQRGGRNFSDSAGNYTITMQPTDTLLFYYRGLLAASYPFYFLTSFKHFDVYLSDKPTAFNGVHDLGTVRVQTQSAKDSLQDRQTYSDIFGYKKPKVRSGLDTKTQELNLLDIASVANVLSFKRKKQAKLDQKFALTNEQQNYVQRTFTKSLVAKYTGMQSDDSLSLFIIEYAPTYDELKNMNDLDLGMYIITNAAKFRQQGKK